MVKIAYTLVISIVYLFFRYLVLTIFQIEAEFFFLIGTMSVVILYFMKELPLLFVLSKKNFKKRCISYLISGFITSILFTLFYLNYSELTLDFLSETLLLSLELHMTAIFIYYFPIEVYKTFRRQSER